MKTYFFNFLLIVFLSQAVSAQNNPRTYRYTLPSDSSSDWTYVDKALHFGIDEYIRLAEPFSSEAGSVLIRLVKFNSDSLTFSLGAFEKADDLNKFLPFARYEIYKEHPVLIRKPLNGNFEFADPVDAHLNFSLYTDTLNLSPYFGQKDESEFPSALIRFYDGKIDINIYDKGSLPAEYSLYNTDY